MNRNLKVKLTQAKKKLNQTIQHILEINRHRKRIPNFSGYKEKAASKEEELKVLNKIAAQQARIIRHYESALDGEPTSRPVT